MARSSVRFQFNTYRRDFDEVKKRVGTKGKRRIKRRIDDHIEQGVRNMAEGSFQLAPEDTGALKHSIMASVQKEGWAEYIYGSHLPYAQRQNYEHRTRGYYFEKSINPEKVEMKGRLAMALRSDLGGKI